MPTLDCDIIARQIVKPGEEAFKKIVELFGKKVVLKKGTLDRAGLRNIIVNDSLLRQKLENILHPQIIKEMVVQMEEAESEDKKAVVVEVPLLFELGMEKQFDITIAVMAKDMDLIKRISDRDNITREDAQKILDLQMSQENKKARADHVILNRGKRSELFESVDNLFSKIRKEFLTT